MRKPGYLAIATAVFSAGIANGLIYTLGYLAIVVIQFVTKGGDGASFGGAVSALLVTLLFSVLLATIVTIVLALPIAAICRAFGFTGPVAYFVAPAIGAAIACAIASLLGVAWSTYAAIIAFAYITAAVMWLMFGRPGTHGASGAAA